jgi:hypothetical protein
MLHLMAKKSKENLKRWRKKTIFWVSLIGSIASIIGLLLWFFTPSPMVKITFGDNNSLPLLKVSQSGNVKIEKLGISKILYQPPGKKNKPREIHINETVESAGIIWFQLYLKELGGYLLVYSKDSNENLFNLFPGTKKAVLNGNYKIPDCINNPTTEIQQITLKNMRNKNLQLHKILLGGYEFDSSEGIETFYFYYTNKIFPELEKELSKARDTRYDLPSTQGINNKFVVYSSTGTVNNQLKIACTVIEFAHVQ